MNEFAGLFNNDPQRIFESRDLLRSFFTGGIEKLFITSSLISNQNSFLELLKDLVKILYANVYILDLRHKSFNYIFSIILPNLMDIDDTIIIIHVAELTYDILDFLSRYPKKVICLCTKSRNFGVSNQVPKISLSGTNEIQKNILQGDKLNLLNFIMN